MTHRVAGHTLGPRGAPRALSACPLGVVVAKPSQKQNWGLGSVLLLVVKEMRILYFLVFPPFLRGVSGLSIHEAELSPSFYLH